MAWQFGDKKLLVYGLGASGISTVKSLIAADIAVIAWDQRDHQRAAAEALGAICLDETAVDWSDIAAVILSPGIPLTHPEPHDVVKLAQQHDVEVIGDVELFCSQQRRGQIIAITGTNGKSTTTALIGHIMRQAGRDVAVGGNIGVPVLDLPDSDFYVLELSSYQIDLCPSMRADIAVLLNITPDHLSRHGGMAGYRAVKKRLLDQQNAGAVAVIGQDAVDQIQASASLGGLTIKRVAVETDVPTDVYVRDGQLYDAADNVHTYVTDLTRCESLQGQHNWQNAACAWAACRAAGLSENEIISGLHSFGGLAHRMEQLGVIDGIRFVNDSKATNAEAAAPALRSYQNIYWILGGQAKEGGIDSLEPLLGRIHRAYTIGASGQDFADHLQQAGKAVTSCGDLVTATEEALRDARQDGLDKPVILLSPACASWDQFTSFEHRGDVFRELVKALTKNDSGRAA